MTDAPPPPPFQSTTCSLEALAAAPDDQLPASVATSVTASASLPSRSQLSCTRIRAEILRGVRLSRALQSFGALLRTPTVDWPLSAREKAWHQSEECTHIHSFLSQSWTSSGRQKYVALLMHFYWKPAFVVGLVTAFVCMTLDGLRILPTLTQTKLERLDSDGKDGGAQVCPWCVVPPIAALATLFLAPNCQRLQRRTVFLDALCIHQVDQQLKSEGIRCLAGFLANSNELIVLWSKTYFRRAWCVFELAVYVAIHGADAVRFCPLFASTALIIGYGIACALCAVASAADCVNVPGATGNLVWLPRVVSTVPMAYLIHKLRQEMLAMQELGQQLDRFSLEHAQCRFPEDLESIKTGIVELWGGEEQFSVFVRGKLKATIGDMRQYFAYRQCLIAMLPTAGYWIQSAIVLLHAGNDVVDLLPGAVSFVAVIFCHQPGMLKLVNDLAHRFAKPYKCLSMDVACSIGIALAGVAYGLGGLRIIVTVTSRLRFGFLLVIGVSTIFSCTLFRPELLRQIYDATQRGDGHQPT